jgi:hypothetical protein
MVNDPIGDKFNPDKHAAARKESVELPYST